MKKYTLLLTSLFSFSLMNAQYFEQDTSAGDFTANPLHQAGANLMDFNNDYRLDVLAMGYDNAGENRSRIYENVGAGNFSSIPGSDFYMVGTGGPAVISGDFDNDGDLDVYQLNFQNSNGTPANNVLYENTGAPNFEFQATSLVGNTGEETFSGSGTWVDYDYDGDLDLYATGANNTPDLFYRNDGGSFTRIQNLAFLETRSWFITLDTWFDFDDDGDLDVYFSNYQGFDNKLYLSQFIESGDPNSFVETNVSGITNNGGSNIGANWIDYDNDLDLDLFLNYFNASDKLYRNNGDGSFTEITNQPMTQNSGWTTVNSWADFDNDGDLDFYQNTGSGSNFPGFLYENNGTGEFTNVSSTIAGDITNSIVSPQGGGWGDYDNDGDMDLAIITCCATFPSGAALNNLLFENKVGQNNNFSKIHLEGVQSNKRGIGAIIQVRATINGNSVWQTRRISGGIESFGMQEQQMAHFGLGDATIIDSLVIKWPSGQIDMCDNIPIGSIIMQEGNCVPTILNVQNAIGSNNIDIFPNPTIGKVTVRNNSEHAIDQISIISLLGEKIMKEIPEFMESEFNDMDLTFLHQGIYFIALELSNGDTIYKRVIKE